MNRFVVTLAALAGIIPVISPWGARAAEESDPAALAAALKDAKVTLQEGLKASEREGTPISAKFEVADGKLQLSVYTAKSGGFSEVVVDPKTGAIAEAEKITDPRGSQSRREAERGHGQGDRLAARCDREGG